MTDKSQMGISLLSSSNEAY